MKKIAFVATGYIRNYDGISVYTENLLQELLKHEYVKNGEVSIDIFIGKDVTELLQERIHIPEIDNIAFIAVNDTSKIKKIIDLTWKLRSHGKYDLIFITNFMPTILMPAKTVKVIHDFSVNLFPELYSRKYKIYHDLLLLYARYFDYAIGYISEVTKKDLMHFHHINHDNKQLVYLPNGIPFKVKNHDRPHQDIIEKKFAGNTLELLVVGRINRHKGFDRILTFCRYFDKKLQTMSRYEKVTLNIVGKQTAETKNIFESLQLKNIDIVFHGFLDDDGLNEMYMKSHFCFFLSRNEGYGLPLLETMWFRCFPLVSNIPIFKEILGDEIVKFDDISGYGKAIEQRIFELCD
ncbi:MAG: glycosyltransferase, partial [Bacteroidales bacterium]|nr:glycosyltransferase [Bacteroidales bacterium]